MKDKNSARDSIKKLRKCSPDERRTLAIAFARTRDLHIIDELIRMAEGRYRSYFSRYSEDNQLIGIEAIGESKNSYLLQYIVNLSKRRVDARREDYRPRGEKHPVSYIILEVEHLRAQGRLKKILKYTKSEKPNAGNSIEHVERAERFEDAIENAKSKLESALAED